MTIVIMDCECNCVVNQWICFDWNSAMIYGSQAFLFAPLRSVNLFFTLTLLNPDL